MKRGPLKRRKALKRANEARRAQRRARQFGLQAALCRCLPCCVCGSPPPSDPAHVRSRGAGGRDADTVPLCRSCHQRQHEQGIRTFQREAGVDLAAVAKRLSEGLG